MKIKTIFQISYFNLSKRNEMALRVHGFFRFDIYFKSNIVLRLGFKVLNVKNLHSKNLKCKFKYCIVNIFQLIYFCNYRIPN